MPRGPSSPDLTRRKQLDRAFRRLGHLDPRDRAVVERFTLDLTHALLAGPIRDIVAATETEGNEVNELYRYLTLSLSPEWRRLHALERASQKLEFTQAAEDAAIRLHAYSLVGTRTDADLMLWAVADELDDLRRFEARLASTALWSHSTRPHGYLATRRRSPYIAGHAHDGGEEARGTAGPVGDTRHVVVYPLTKKRSWYALPLEERMRIMGGHFAVGHRYPDIRIHTAYSFGIDDHEFVVSFETDDIRRFVALVADLRETESSAYTERETPILVGTRMPLSEALDSVDGANASELVR